MSPALPNRLLTIGEFAAATQLTPKALRLYDEQQVMRPAVTDPSNGYRYYRSDQIPTGRLIRTLREMNLPLTQVAQVVATPGTGAEALLHSMAQEVDRRYAQEKRAFQSALMLLRAPTRNDAPTIEAIERAAEVVSVRPFTSDRRQFVERFAREAGLAHEDASARGVTPVGHVACALIEPLSDEEGQLEVLTPISLRNGVPHGLTVRQLPASRVAAVTGDAATSHAAEFTAALDAIFDWFDRHGHAAVGVPVVTLQAVETGWRTRVLWAFESSADARR
jgi:DNA-binding transcriptional MerR regulator